jgi:hypothetical protein
MFGEFAGIEPTRIKAETPADHDNLESWESQDAVAYLFLPTALRRSRALHLERRTIRGRCSRGFRFFERWRDQVVATTNIEPV